MLRPYAHQLYNFGLKISLLPALLINSFFAVLTSIMVNEIEPSWDFTFQSGILLSVLVFATFMILATVGISRISSYLASHERRLSDISSIFLGLSTGTALVILGNFFLMVVSYVQIFIVSSLHSIVTILLLAFLGRRMNKFSNERFSNEEVHHQVDLVQLELHTAWWTILVACIGCGVFVIIDTIDTLLFGGSPWPYLEIMGAVPLLGNSLLITLPFAFAGGYLLGLATKKMIYKGSLSKWNMMSLGVLMGLLIAAGLFLFLGTTCLSYRFICSSDFDSIGNLTNIESYYQLRYLAALIIAACGGAAVGQLLFVKGLNKL
ncbi:MAG: hypothetical protein KPEEDBHJ_01375 [Anaerolineales bacterium]|nr:hypothetical protein [Anaerolineales bacterium]